MNAHFTIPRIDVGTASREKLIAHIDHLEWILADVLPAEPIVAKLRVSLGLAPQEARIVGALLAGRLCTHSHLLNTVIRIEDTQSNILGVLINRCRRKLQKVGVSIKLVWGVGYHLEPDDLKRLRAFIEEKAAA